MNPRICNFYITFQCNDTCEFCQVWQSSGYSSYDLRASEDKQGIGIKLEELKKRGIQILNIDGGEPLLVEHLPRVIEKAKELGIFIRLFTNGIVYPDRAKELRGLSDEICFAMDYPSADAHDRSRGIESFSELISSLKTARELGEKAILFFTMTRDSVLYLPEAVELAEKHGTILQLNPVYDFNGTQGFDKDTVRHIRYFFKRKSVRLDLAVLEFARNRGNSVLLPRCRASQAVLTLLPDLKEVGPCLYNQGGRQGREDICSSCMRWPYIEPSFKIGFDKYRMLHIYSKWYNSKKLIPLPPVLPREGEQRG
ncbi:MAG: radical SAM protein [Candidatus Margulisiibacteriota bacterium]